MLKINKVILNNYWSYGYQELEYKYDKPVLVIGERKDECFSSNGAGKSSLFEAMMWCLFAKTTKGLLANTVVNYKIGKDCFVSVEGTVNNIPFVVTRYRLHSTHKNDVHFLYNNIDSRGATNQETNIKIEKTLNLDFEFFKQTCFFNPRTVQGFCSLSDSNKKNILEYILNLNKWEDYYNSATQELNKAVSEKESLVVKLNQTKANKARFIENVYKPFLISDFKRDDMRYRLTCVEDELSRIKLTPVEQPREDVISLTANARILKERINSKDNCLTCGQPISLDVPKLKQQLSGMLKTIKSAEHQKLKYTKYLADLDKLNKLTIEKTNLEKEIDLCEKRSSNVKKLRLEVLSYQGEINLIKEVLKEYNKTINNLNVLKKAFSPKGIKSYIIKDILPYLNSRLEHYSGELTNNSIKIRITFDYDSNRLISSINKDVPYDYANLSSGEAKRVDLCMLFSLLDLMSTLKNRPNFIILDEIFDSLDNSGLDKVVNLLYNIKYENIFVITHNNDLKEHFNSTLFIKNEQGISHIVDGNEGHPPHTRT